MTWRFSRIGFIAAVVWPATITVAQAPDCNCNGVPDAIDLAGKIYWTDQSTDKIQRADLDGKNVETLVTTGVSAPVGIALDPVAGKMYWTEDLLNKVQRADLDGSTVEGLVTMGLVDPSGIALALPSPDTDADGVMDECDGCPNDATKIVPGICGCGVVDADTDGDGTPDCFDQCPDDPAKIAPGNCGCGVSDVDTDGDGISDCLQQLPPPAGQPTTDTCGCGNGMDGMMMMPMTMLGIGWMRRRTSRRQRGRWGSARLSQ